MIIIPKSLPGTPGLNDFSSRKKREPKGNPNRLLLITIKGLFMEVAVWIALEFSMKIGFKAARCSGLFSSGFCTEAFS
jgi:hypothetical protein